MESCYQVIANATFDELAVGVCDRLTGSKDTLHCMSTIRDGVFENANAIRVCESLSEPFSITSCLGAINFEHIQDDALAVCARFESREFATDCMESIAGKTYTQREIFQCERERSEEEIALCFDDNGKHYPNYFERRTSQYQNQASKVSKCGIPIPDGASDDLKRFVLRFNSAGCPKSDSTN
jgi:hypothetical protein